ncbi:MAG: AtpZ/AtpI family protein [Terracidiphilus sp.]
MPFHRDLPESKPPAKSSGALRGYIEAEKLMNLAFVLPSAVVIGWGAGWWADNRLHQHWIAIVGTVFGCISGLYYVIQQAIAAEKISRKEDPAKNEGGKGSGGPPS